MFANRAVSGTLPFDSGHLRSFLIQRPHFLPDQVVLSTVLITLSLTAFATKCHNGHLEPTSDFVSQASSSPPER